MKTLGGFKWLTQVDVADEICHEGFGFIPVVSTGIIDGGTQLYRSS